MPGRASEVLVLASASPRRRDILTRAGVAHEIIPADIDERTRPGESPTAMTLRLAREKALFVARRVGRSPRRLVLGSDTTVALGDETFGKPRDRDDALRLLRELAGRTHCVVTAVAIVASDTLEVTEQAVESFVTMRTSTDDELRAYIATGEPMDKAGAYAFQGEGRALIERLDGSETNVIGLPLDETLALLRASGLDAR